MTILESLLLGILQGLTEYLPISSSGHLTLGSHLLDITDPDTILPYTVLVHIATVLSTIVILRKDIAWIFKGLFSCNKSVDAEQSTTRLNSQQYYVLAILVSMIPVGIVGLFFQDYIDAAFSGTFIVGCCLLLTAALLAFSYYAKPRQKERITIKDAFIIGLGQALATLPGLSRSGTTIATGLLLGDKKEQMAQFSFLMVIPPILGKALLDSIDVIKNGIAATFGSIDPWALLVGFLAAFVSGCVACKWMISIVRKGKLIYFAYYCLIVGTVTIILSIV
ncbi:MAG: undecaprenyl-diphosphate phosphatase [Bacteroidaceae bacterium]|nr:undecaprenyl-diphosphate phosphatase [Bacteroidaceae bacterium]